MRSVSVALAALIGLAAANPLEWPRNARPPYPTGVTSKPDTITYTTETICPVTYTHGTEIKTTLTTSTITITSCKGGCHKPTPPPVYTPPPHDYKTITKTYTTITYTFVPCSTSVGKNDYSVIYSTYLSQSAVTQTLTTYEVIKPTPAPPAITPVPEAPKPGTCTAFTTITAVVDYFSCPPAPPAVTSTVTVTVGKPAPPPCHECVKSYTVTEGDYTTCITYTFDKPPVKPTETPKKPHYTPPVYTPPVYTPPVHTPPKGTGHSKPYPKPTGGYTKGW